MATTTTTTTIRKKQYQSDFALRLKMKQLSGKVIDTFPQCDFDLVFTCGGKSYTCSRKDSTYSNCEMNTDGTLTCVFDNHGLLTGKLMLEAYFYTPDALYPDGTKKSVLPQFTGIELVMCGGEDTVEFDIDTVMPYAIITAYQMAVNAGYTGTEQEWLDMMTGSVTLDIRQSEGDSTTAVMSQKATTDSLAQRDKTLDDYINKMKAELMQVVIMKLVGDSPVLVGGENTYTIQANCTETVDSFSIWRGETPIASAVNTNVISVSETPKLSRGTLVYRALAELGSYWKDATISIPVVLPVYIGAGAYVRDIIDDTHKQTARTNPSGTYTIEVQTKGDYVWLAIPDDMTFVGAEMGGFHFPMSKNDAYLKDYNVYRSDLQYKAGTMEITVL